MFGLNLHPLWVQFSFERFKNQWSCCHFFLNVTYYTASYSLLHTVTAVWNLYLSVCLSVPVGHSTVSQAVVFVINTASCDGQILQSARTTEWYKNFCNELRPVEILYLIRHCAPSSVTIAVIMLTLLLIIMQSTADMAWLFVHRHLWR